MLPLTCHGDLRHDFQGLQDGEEYEAEVVKIMEFGAFVDLPGGFGALLHISELANYRVQPCPCPCCIQN